MSAPLADVTVVDLTRALAGPHATMMLADLGAHVIKVESPAGDDTRGWGPPFLDLDEVRESTYFMSANRNKESIVLDLRSEEGKDVLRRLVRRADVLAENFRPGVLARLGFSEAELHELNPALVILSITGFGHDGPEGGRAGYDQIAQGEAGLMSLTGPTAEEPIKVGVPIADLLAGMNGAFGVLAALHEREQTGRGRVVRTSLLASVIGIHGFQGTRATIAGEVPRASGNQHTSIAPYGLFRTADAPVQIAVGSEGLWAVFAPLVGIATDDPRFATNGDRVTRREELRSLIEDDFACRSSAELLAMLDEAGVPAGKVRTLDDVYAWEQTRSQGLVIEVEHPVFGALALPGPVLRFDDNSWAGGRKDHTAPPMLDEHRDRVLAWLADGDSA